MVYCNSAAGYISHTIPVTVNAGTTVTAQTVQLISESNNTPILIIGGVLLIGTAYYLYNKNKVKKSKA